MIVKDLGLVDYVSTCSAMQDFTANRGSETVDELWLLEHYPVFSQGTNGLAEHLLDLGEIPLVQSDRGGQVTYHGPGQLIVYTLFDLRRLGLGVRDMVNRLENSVITVLNDQGIDAYSDAKAPGVYIAGEKVASLGLRVKRGACYHGVSINVDMDLSPFLSINPCGYQGMKMTDLKSLGSEISMVEMKQHFVAALTAQIN
ncbi:MAG: lipoyl(octanoyl) transferase [Methylophagaceae bacterium]|jgi:lipoyl(octanoyl) transferase